LQDAVAPNDHALARVDLRLVKRMGQRRDHTPRDLARQLRVRIERYDKANARRLGDRAAPSDEAGVRVATEEAIKLSELAALALPAHPTALGSIPLTAPMQ